MGEVTTALDLKCFAYILLSSPANASPLLISTYPSNWTSHYLQSRYERCDPVIAQALCQTEPFEWGLGTEHEISSEPERRLFDEASRFGIRCGFTIPIHDSHGAIAAVTFASDEQSPTFAHSVAEYRTALQLIAMYFHAHARRKILARTQIDGIALSPRETECLGWAAQGKSAWDIGSIMGISHHTVTFHLDNARAKLGVRSTIQAVARFVAATTTP